MQQQGCVICLPIAQHYAWLAYRHQMLSMAIDLLELQIEPVELDIDIERNLILAAMWQQTLK